MARQIKMMNETQKVKSKKGKVIHTAEKTPAGSLRSVNASSTNEALAAQQEQTMNRRQAFRQMVSQSLGGTQPVTAAPRTASQGPMAVQMPQDNPYLKAAVRQTLPAYQRPVDPITAAAANMLRNNARGNIDLYNRPQYRQPDGSISTVNSISIGTTGKNGDQKETLIPTIGRDKNGRPVQWTDEEAIDHYYKTGENLGKFNTVEEANDYAERLHRQQEAYYSPENSPLRLNNMAPKPYKLGDAVKRFESGASTYKDDPEADRYIEQSIRTSKNPFVNSSIGTPTIDPQTGDVTYTAEHGRNNWLNDYNVRENLESDEARKARQDALNTLIAYGKGDGRTGYESTVLRNMTEDEQREYSYRLGKYGREEAEKYLDQIGERVTNRRAAEIVENVNRNVVPEEGNTPTSYVNPRTGEVIENARSGNNPINTLAKAGKMGKLAAQSGLDMFASGVGDKFTNYVTGGTEVTPATAEARASQAIKEQLSGPGRVAYDVVENSAMMAPTMAATAAAALAMPPLAPQIASVGVPSLGAAASAKAAADAAQIFGIGATMFPMSAGQAYEEALQKGMSPNQARLFGTLEGLNQAGLEYALGGFEDLSGGFAKKAVDNVLGNVVADETKSKAAQTVARAVQHFLTTPEGRMAFSMGSEAFEEIVQGSVSNALNNAFFGENNGPVSQEDLYSGLVAALSAGMSNARYYAGRYANGVGRVYSAEDIRAAADNIITDRAAYVNQEAYDAAMEQRDQMLAQADYVEQGGNLTPLERGELGEAAGGALAEMDRIGRRARNESDIREVTDALKTAQEIAQTEETKQEVEKISTRANDIIKRRAEGAQVTDAEVGRLINDTIRTTLTAGNEKAAATAEARTRMGFGEQGNTVMESSQATGQKAEALTALYEEARYDIKRNDAQKQLASTLLSEQELSAMYQAGIQDRNAFYNTDYSDKIGKIAEKYRPGNIKRGNVTYDGVDMDALQKAGDNESRAKYAQMKTIEHFLAGTLGYNVEWFESKTADGKYEGENGSYNRAKHLIRLDINAGAEVIGDKVKFANVIAHELTHTIEDGSPMQYQKIANTVMKALVADQEYSRGRNAEQIIADMIENNPYVKNEADAIHELVAQACEDMMNGNADIRAMFEGMNESERNTIFDHISNIFAAIKNFFDDLLNSDAVQSNRTEAAAIRRAKENIESLEKEWTEGVKRAAAYNAAAYEESRRQAAETEAADAEYAEEHNSQMDQFSVRQFAEAFGFKLKYEKFTETDANGEEVTRYYKLYDPATGKPVKRVTAKMMDKTPMGTLVNAALAAGSIDEKVAAKQKKMFADLMNLTIQYDNLPMVWEIAGAQLFSAIKSNSDAQYGSTVDFGTVCAKTQAIVDTMSRVMVEKGRGLTRAEVIKVYNEVANNGLSVPCPVCYVFSRWMGVPSLLENMRKCQERFSNMSDKEINEYVHSMEEKYGQDLTTDDESKKKKPSELINAEKVKVQDRVRAAEEDLRQARIKKQGVEEALKTVEELQNELNDLEAYNWVTQVLCKTNRKRQAIRDANGNVTKDPKYKAVPPEILLDLTRTGEFADPKNGYSKSWVFRTTRGAGMGKAILPYSGATIGDTVRGAGSSSPTRYNAKGNPFLNMLLTFDKKGNAHGKAFSDIKAAIKRIKAQNLIGGQRFQSTSDFRAEWGIDYLMTFLEAQAIGAKGQLYTKVIEAVDMFASAGIEVNLSIMGKGNGYHMENGKPVLGVEDFSSVTGIDFSKALEKTKKYSNVQMILVGLNDTHIRLALADDRITFIIPWHSSGSNEATLKSLMSGLNETLENGTDYSDTQSDGIIPKEQDPEYEKHQKMRNLRKAIVTGQFYEKSKNAKSKTRYLTEEEKQLLNENAYLNNLYNMYYVDETSDAYGVKLSGTQAMTSKGVPILFPYEYWDKTSTIKNADVNGQRFQDYCASLGMIPRFSGFVKDGVTYGNFTKDKGYWKLLIDRRMYDLKGKYHAPSVIDVTKVKVESVPTSVNSNNYKDTESIDAAVRDSLMAIDNVGNEMTVTDTQMSARVQNNPAVFDGQPFWSGSVSLIDGVIEEVHTYEEAENWDFHHSLYFSPQQIEKMDSGENAFFFVDGDTIDVEDISGFRDEIPESIVRKIRKQITPNREQMSNRDSFGNVSRETVDRVTEDSVSAMIDNGYTEKEAAEAVEVGGFVQYSTRTAPAPKKTITAYKAFYAVDGKLYPPMVANDVEEEQNNDKKKSKRKGKKKVSGTLNGMETPVGIWIDADVGALAYDDDGKPLRNTKGRLAVKNAKGGGTLAFRPGWHLGLWPDAKQFNVKDPITGKIKACMPDGLVFARCSVAADNDYQLEALGYGMGSNGKFNRTQAGLPRIPVDGYYMYRTNALPDTAPWIISGAIRVEEILDDDMAAEICKQYGITADPRASHKKINLADYGLKAGSVTPTEDTDRFLPNNAVKANAAALEEALNDPAYANAYVANSVNFDDPEIVKELARNGQSAEFYKTAQEKYGNKSYAVDNPNDSLINKNTFVVGSGNAQMSSRTDIEAAADDPSNTNVIRMGSDQDVQYSFRLFNDGVDERLKVRMATLFSGAGTVDFALRSIVNHEFAVEFKDKIAAVYRANNGGTMYVKDIQTVNVDPHKGRVEYLHISPVCTDYSNANNKQGERDIDLKTAEAAARIIDELQPKVVTVENVRRYKNSRAVQIIEEALERNGYLHDKKVYRASDFGGATIRERMFIRAVKDGVLPKVDTSEYTPLTWYDAVKDMIPKLPPAELSNYMRGRLGVSGIDPDNLKQPVFVLGGEKSGELTFATADKPAPTILAKSTEAKILMPDGRILRATPRVMARIQGLPDEFDLGLKNDYDMEKSRGNVTNAYRVVGNGVPVQLTQGIVGPLLEENLIKQKSEATGIQYSSRNTGNAPTFYSKLQREIQNYKGEKIGAASVESYLKGKGVKNEEIKWSGIRTFLEGKKSVNKQELMQYLRDNEMEIEQTVLDDNPVFIGPDIDGKERAFRSIEEIQKVYADKYGEDILMNEDYDDYMERYSFSIDDEDYSFSKESSGDNETHWEGYRLDGGENYREILFRIPGSNYSNQAMSTHWNEPGVLAHARVQDFDAADGGKVLFVEEIQSDWHNAGQKHGYSNDFNVVEGEYGQWLLKDANGKTVAKTDQLYTKERAKEALMNQVRNKVAPDAPFRTTYTDYVLKNLLRMAAEGDYDYLAWTTGKMQEERWSDEFAEGYRIEYDQQIPKFLKKYGKQWGAKLTEIGLWTSNDSPQEVDSKIREFVEAIREYDKDATYESVRGEMPGLVGYAVSWMEEDDPNWDRITGLAKEIENAEFMNSGSERMVPAITVNDAMKDSVLNEGQPMYSARSNGFDQRTSFGTVEELERRNENIWHINYTLDQVLRDRGAQTQKVSDYQIKRIANRFIREYNSKADADTIAEGLKAMYEYIEYDAKISAQQVGKIATAYAEQIIDESKDFDDTMAAMYPGLGEDIKRRKLYVSPEAMKEMAYYFDGAADFRRQARKYMNISERPGEGIGIDTYYQELSESYPELFDPDVANEKDQLLQIFDVAEQLKAKTIDKDWGSEYDEVAYTLGQDLVAAYFAEKGDGNYKRTIDQIKVQMAKDHKEQMANLRRYKDQQIKEIKDKLTGERRMNTAQIAELRARLQEQHRQREEKASLRRLTTQAKAKLQRQARQLWSKRGTPEFERAKAKLFSELDLVSVGITKGGRLSLERTYNEARRQAALDPDYAASAEYENIKLKFLGDPANPAAERKHLRDLSYEEIVDLTQDILALKNSQQTYNKVIKENYEANVADYGRRGVAQQGRVKGILNQKGRRAKMLAAVKKYALYMENPVRAAHLLDGYQEGGVLTELFDDINDGTTKKTRFQQQANQMFEEILKDKKLTDGWSDQNIEINVGAGKYYISKGMRISIALHARNDDNIRHINFGGFNIPDERLYKAGRYTDAYNAGTTVQMTEEEMRQIASEMTPEEKKFANIAYRFFNHTTKDAINETSMVLKGYELAIVPNYMPIRTDPNFTQAEIDGLIHDGTIEGKGQFKDRQPGAKNPILLEDIAQVIERQTQTTAAYYGLAIPVRNMNKVWKYTATAYKASLKKAIAENWGQLGKDTIEKMIKDIQAGARRGDTGDHVFSFLKGAQAAATLTMNVGVSMKQFASYPLAISMLDADCLMKGLRAKTDRAYIDSITPWSWDRRHGMGGEEMGDIFKQKGMIARNQTVQNVKNMVNWIQAVDVFTTDHLFAACEAQVQKDNPDLEVRGKEYNEKVATLYNDVLWRTQPSYGVMQRNELMRSASTIMKALTMYKTQTFNMGGEIIDAGLRAITMKDMAKDGLVSNDEAKKANQDLKKVLWGTVLSQATLAALSAVAAAALRKMKPYRDDKGEITASSLMKKVGTDFVTSWFGLFFGADLAEQAVGSVLNFANWYDVTAPQLDGLNDTVNDMSAWSTALGKYIDDGNAENKSKLIKSSVKMSMTIAGTFGVPARNAYNMVNALNLMLQDVSEGGGGFFSFEAGNGLFGLQDTSPTGKQYAKRAVDAYKKGDTTKGDRAAEKASKSALKKEMGGNKQEDVILFFQENNLDDAVQRKLWEAAGYKPSTYDKIFH